MKLLSRVSASGGLAHGDVRRCRGGFAAQGSLPPADQPRVGALWRWTLEAQHLSQPRHRNEFGDPAFAAHPVAHRLRRHELAEEPLHDVLRKCLCTVCGPCGR